VKSARRSKIRDVGSTEPKTRGDEDETPKETDGDALFLCREGPPILIDEEQVLRAAFYRLPLRAGFTDEVLTRIRECSSG